MRHDPLNIYMGLALAFQVFRFIFDPNKLTITKGMPNKLDNFDVIENFNINQFILCKRKLTIIILFFFSDSVS